MVKMSSEKGPKYIYAQEHVNTVTIIMTLESIEGINPERMKTKHSEEYFFH